MTPQQELIEGIEAANLVKMFTAGCAAAQPRPSPQVVLFALASLTAALINVSGLDPERSLALFVEGVRDRIK